MGDLGFGNVRRCRSHRLLAALACVAILVGGCSKSEPQQKADGGVLDTSRLPRVSGAKEIFASPASTIFSSPASVAETADALDKALVAGGWQQYVAPATARASDPGMRTVTLKKGTQAISVFTTVAPAQGNATSVQYSILPLKTELPFIAGASDIEYSPERALLTFVTAEPADRLLDFYRKELAARGWVLWSQKLHAKQPDGGSAGIIHRHGVYAQYVSDKEPNSVLMLTSRNADGGKSMVELKEWPIAVLKTGIAAKPAAKTDVGQLPRLASAKDDGSRSSAERLVYSVSGSLPNTVEAARALLAEAGWKPYRSPSEGHDSTLLFFKKGPQGLVASFTMTAGRADESSVSIDAQWIYVDVPVPDDAADLVFDDNRPYLTCVTASTAEAALEFYRQELGAAGWVPLQEADAKAQWPHAVFGNNNVYFIREKQKPIMLSLQPAGGEKTRIEIRVAPFALPQTLEAGRDFFGLPSPKLYKTAGGSGGSTQHEMHALVPAELETLLAFYRRELGARNWKEDADGAVLKPEQASLKFSSPQGPALLTLGRQFDLTTVSLVQRVTQPATQAAPPASVRSADDSLDAMLRDAQHMMRDMNTTPGVPAPSAQPTPKAAQPALRAAADGKTPVPIPDGAEELEFDDGSGTLEFSSAASVKQVGEFYRAAMRQQGWQEGASVINRANMIVLNFSKAGKAISFTIMQMGNKANVSANGNGLKGGEAKATAATGEDLEPEQSGGLPVPKRHTMSEGTTTPFRRELKATVPLGLNDVLGFYRRELGKMNWYEQGQAAVTADGAMVAFMSPEGPAVLKLARKDDAIIVSLAVKNPAAAEKAGVLPKPGHARVLFGNINPVAVVITFNGKRLKVASGAGTKAPDGPMLDVPPGKYKYSARLSGVASGSEEVDLRADETWGLMIGPGGVLTLQAY